MLALSPDHDIQYLDPFLGPQTGSLYITDYKMYFKASTATEGLVRGVAACMRVV